jgi:hypothetical protein
MRFRCHGSQCITILCPQTARVPPTGRPLRGSAIPVKFSLGGDQGLDVLRTGYPQVATVSCSTSAPTDVIETTVTAGAAPCSATRRPTSTPTSGRPTRTGPGHACNSTSGSTTGARTPSSSSLRSDRPRGGRCLTASHIAGGLRADRQVRHSARPRQVRAKPGSLRPRLALLKPPTRQVAGLRSRESCCRGLNPGLRYREGWKTRQGSE